MLLYGVGATRAPWPIRAQAVCAGEGHHSAEGIMTEKHLPDDLDLNEKGLANRAKGKAEEIKGQARHAFGGLTGDKSQQLKGKGEELKGKAQQAFGKAQQKVDDVIDREKH
jgi:uncharacterized protein YjbJ (UPF0337 family)